MYYVLNNSTDIKEIGSSYPQVWEMAKSHEENMIIYIDNWQRTYNPQEIAFKFKLDNNANFTDLLSASFLLWNFKLVSQNLMKIISNSLKSINNPIFYPATISKKAKSQDYFVFYMSAIKNEVIDFQKSKFATTNSLSFFKDFIEINNETEYELATKDFNRAKVRFSSITLKENIEEDIFFIEGIRKLVISEKAKQIFEKENINGIDLIPIDQFSSVKFRNT